MKKKSRLKRFKGRLGDIGAGAVLSAPIAIGSVAGPAIAAAESAMPAGGTVVAACIGGVCGIPVTLMWASSLRDKAEYNKKKLKKVM